MIAIDRILQHLQNHDHVDVYGVVYEMRKERYWMVQTEVRLQHAFGSAVRKYSETFIFRPPKGPRESGRIREAAGLYTLRVNSGAIYCNTLAVHLYGAMTGCKLVWAPRGRLLLSLDGGC